MDALESASTSLQLRALQVYLVLLKTRETWSKRLVLLEISELSNPAALAAKAAGAAVLLIAKDPTFLREANQAGVTDFNINSLSEAVRILKNEIRKGLPISVGLLDMQRNVWHEVVERGLQPDALFAGIGIPAEVAEVLLERGAQWIDLRVLTNGNTADVRRTGLARNWRDRIVNDGTLLTQFEQLPELQRASAVRWLQAASRLFPRDLDRCYAAAWNASNEIA